MPKMRVSLSIGLTSHEDIIDIDEKDWNACETDEEREALMKANWDDWSACYIDGGYKLIN